MKRIPAPPLDDDSDLAALLQQTGGRDMAPTPVHDAVWAAVHADWQAMVRERKSQRRSVRWSAAAVVAIGCATLLVLSALQPTAGTVATVEHIDGHLIGARDVGERIVVGGGLQTDAGSRAALRWPGGLSLRLDHNTAIQVAFATRLALLHGTVYVDVPGQDDSLSIHTALGTVRHLGTQYMVSARPDLLEVSIRAGQVSISSKQSSLIASAGERIRMNATGAVERTTLNANDDSWDWTLATTPTFQIDNQSLAAFLAWISQQTGRPVVFESPQAQSAASHVILRGSIEGLDPDTALSVVLSTTQLHRYPTTDDSIGIALNKR